MDIVDIGHFQIISEILFVDFGEFFFPLLDFDMAMVQFKIQYVAPGEKLHRDFKMQKRSRFLNYMFDADWPENAENADVNA